MKAAHYGIWLILLSALQPTLLNYITIYGAKPNLFLIFVILAAFFGGKKDGAVVGAIFGMIYDLLLGKTIGLHAILYMYFGALFGVVSENVLKKPTVIISVPTVLLSSLVAGCIEYLFCVFRIAELSFGYSFFHTILPETIYSALFTVLIYLFLKRTTKIFSMSRRVNE